MKKHFRIKVSGRVQGVWYRQSALETAKRLGIAGFVQNEADGSVYIEAEGEDSLLQRFTEWCKKGPPGAAVKEVKITEGEPENFSSFEIRK